MLIITDVTRIYLGIQGENEARPITINVHPWLIEYPSGSVSIWHKRNGDANPGPTGAVFDDEAETITWTPTSTDTYVDGEGDAEIRLTENGIIKKSKSIKTCVSPAVTGAGVPLGSDWQSYINEVERIKGLAVAAASSKAYYTALAQQYQQNKTYTVGDIRTYDGRLYECTTPIETPEAWTAEHWTETNVMEQIAKMITAAMQ